jgi:hypothetical protein
MIGPVRKRRDHVRPWLTITLLWAPRCGTYILEGRRILPRLVTVRELGDVEGRDWIGARATAVFPK